MFAPCTCGWGFRYPICGLCEFIQSGVDLNQTINKAQLLDLIREGRAQFEALIAQLTPAQMIEPHTVGEWSVKDVMAHFIAHEQHALRELSYALRGEPLPPDLP